ncbi:hypothetical protein BC937DRAFT_94197 [Endogone sp. FLAS-F59071]|nr:hypothetical protein BC937DRAFT_94197 [Endogone sp. FLAS-F59071]|eukprot:RUS20850.1 hypothetical protein BC937DRAFT_94197 [Endogone sp. FLAS-F59071]
MSPLWIYDESSSEADSSSSSTKTEKDNSNGKDNGSVGETGARMHHQSRGRKHEKWLAPVEQARTAMELRNWADLHSGLPLFCSQEYMDWMKSTSINTFQTLENALKTNSASLDLFTPILVEFLDELRAYMNQSFIKDKDYRKNLSKSEAKALTIMSKKVKKSEQWAEPYVAEVERNPPPPTSNDPRSVTRSIERFLLVAPHKTLDLRKLRLKEYPKQLRMLNQVVEYYRAFCKVVDTKNVLEFLSVLDLSGNRLESLPPEIHNLTQLQTLNLADNKFPYFPPELCRLPHLTSIPRITRNPFKRSNRDQARAWIARQKSCNPPSLRAICAAVALRQARERDAIAARRGDSVIPELHVKRKLDSELTLSEICDLVPAPMVSYLVTGHLCELCSGFTSSTDLDQSPGDCSGTDHGRPAYRPTVLIETMYHISPPLLCGQSEYMSTSVSEGASAVGRQEDREEMRVPDVRARGGAGGHAREGLVDKEVNLTEGKDFSLLGGCII